MPAVQETVEQVRRIEVDSLLIGDPCGAQTVSYIRGQERQASEIKICTSRSTTTKQGGDLAVSAGEVHAIMGRDSSAEVDIWRSRP